jgi:hypothetical protein
LYVPPHLHKKALLAYNSYLLTRVEMTDPGPVASSKMESNSKRMASVLVALCLGFFAILLTFDGSSSFGENRIGFNNRWELFGRVKVVRRILLEEKEPESQEHVRGRKRTIHATRGF